MKAAGDVDLGNLGSTPVYEFVRFPPGKTTGDSPVLFHIPVKERDHTQVTE